MKNKEIVPKFFPGEEIKLVVTNAIQLITKIGIDYDGQIDYLCWDGVNYSWLNEFQIYTDKPRLIGFDIKTK